MRGYYMEWVLPLGLGLWLVALGAAAQPPGLDVDQLTPAGGAVRIDYSRLIFNRRTGETSATATLTNISAATLQTPLYLVVGNPQPAGTTLNNALGQTTDGRGYVSGGQNNLAPGESLNLTLVFQSPARDRLTFDAEVYASTSADTTPPSLNLAPADGSTVNTTTPLITVSYNDTGSGVDTASLRILIDGLDRTGLFTITPTGASYVTPLSAGEHTVTVSLQDARGNVAQASSTFTVSVFRAIADCSPTSSPAPLTVTFRTRAEFTGGSIVRYRWDFQGDGIFDTSDAVPRDFTRTFNQPASFDALLEVTNNLNQTAVDTCTIEVGGNAPTATANAQPSNGPVPLNVNFTCTGSDRDGGIVRYEWDFEGDGVFDFSSTSSGGVQHTYTVQGLFSAICRVTDNDGFTGTARATTTVIRSGPPGSPSVTASASPTIGNAALNVNFNGSAIGDGTIVRYEWDFDGDGVFDFSSPSSPATSHRYTNAGIFAPALRVTDNDGLTAIDSVEVIVNLTVNLSIPDDTLDAKAGEAVSINSTLTGGVPVRLLIKNRAGQIVRTLVDAFRAAGSYTDPWDGADDAGQPLPQGVYYAILEYDFGPETRRVDLTDSTGGQSYSPSRNGLPRTFSPFEDDLLTVNFTVPGNRGASEVIAFIGLFRTDTRFITLLDREPLGVGTHTIHWDGLDANGNFAVPPPGDQFLFGIFGFTLPNNAIFIQSAPVISNVSADPNYFDPATPDFITPAHPTTTVTYDLDETADVTLTVTNLRTGSVMRRIRLFNVPAGAGHTVQWDGHADTGLFADEGDYRLAIQATDSLGSTSITRYALIRVFY